MGDENVKYRCGNCGFEGHCYGVATSHGVSAPFCPKCGKNDKLTLIGDADEKILEITRENAITAFINFLRGANPDNLFKALEEHGCFECNYESDTCKKKWTMEVKEVDTTTEAYIKRTEEEAKRILEER